MNTKTKRSVNMLSGPIFSEMIRFCLPLLATYLLDIVFNAADRIVAGQCAGSGALAAVNACGSVINLLTGFFNGLAIGATVVIARHIGANDKPGTERSVHTAAALSGLISLFIFTAILVLSEPLLRLMKTPEDIFEDTTTYFRVRSVGLAINIIYKFSAGALRAAGETKKPLYFAAVAGVLNLGLNFLLVAGFRMGVAGLAIATDVSELVCLAGVLIFQLRTDGPCRLSLRKLRLRWNALREILRIGLPSSIQTSCFNISNAIVQTALNSLGTIALAGAAAATTYCNLCNSCVTSVEHAAMTWSSQNFGARQLGRTWKIVGAAACRGVCPFRKAAACHVRAEK